ncbi:hypothetical protein D3C73_1458820 [compost metagenome]
MLWVTINVVNFSSLTISCVSLVTSSARAGSSAAVCSSSSSTCGSVNVAISRLSA